MLTSRMFFLSSILVFSFALFVISSSSNFTIQVYDTYLVIPLRKLFLGLGFVSLIFSALYYFTYSYLFSFQWSIMHFICFACLLLNVWAYGFVERYYHLQTDESAQLVQMERLMKIQQFFVGSFFILIVMQFSYLANLFAGLFYKRRRS